MIVGAEEATARWADFVEAAILPGGFLVITTCAPQRPSPHRLTPPSCNHSREEIEGLLQGKHFE